MKKKMIDLSTTIFTPGSGKFVKQKFLFIRVYINPILDLESLATNMPPKRAPTFTAYFVFAETVRASVTEELRAAPGAEGKVGVAQIGKAIGEKWRELSEDEKNKFKEAAAAKTAAARAKLVRVLSSLSPVNVSSTDTNHKQCMLLYLNNIYIQMNRRRTERIIQRRMRRRTPRGIVPPPPAPRAPISPCPSPSSRRSCSRRSSATVRVRGSRRTPCGP